MMTCPLGRAVRDIDRRGAVAVGRVVVHVDGGAVGQQFQRGLLVVRDGAVLVWNGSHADD